MQDGVEEEVRANKLGCCVFRVCEMGSGGSFGGRSRSARQFAGSGGVIKVVWP